MQLSRFLLGVIAIVLPCSLAAQDVAPSVHTSTIGPEDTIHISLLGDEDLSKDWRVSVSGDVNLPLLGRVHVAGLTIEEAEQELQERLRKYYKDPQVAIFVAEARSHPVTVMGAVERPGTFQMRGSKTLFATLVDAGGPKSGGEVLTLTRSNEQGTIPLQDARVGEDAAVVEVPVRDVMSGQGPAASLIVRPYDVVQVAQPEEPQLVHVAGEVIKPGAVELRTQNSVSIAKIIAMAGGLTRTASPGRTLIMHVNDQGVRTSSAYIDLNKVISGEVGDIELGPGDIVVVPSSQVMNYLQTVGLSAVNTSIFLLGSL